MTKKIEPGSPGALAFCRVLDLSESIAGQFCGRMLADHGAKVVLVEPPGGSGVRSIGPMRDDAPQESHTFLHLNLGKLSLVVDQATQAGRELLKELARDVDVILVPAGFDRAALHAVNETCCIVTISPFGEDGPLRDWRGSELIYQAMSGMMTQNGDPAREPLYGAGNRASYSAGVAAYIATLAALMGRERLGIAQDVAVDIAHTAASMIYPFALQYAFNGSFETRGNRGVPLVELECTDGFMSMWIKEHQFEAVCRVFGAPGIASDPRFSRPESRRAHFDELTGAFQAVVGDRTAHELVSSLQAHRVVAGCCYRPSQLGPEAPHLRERGYWSVVSTPAGPRHVLGPQFRLSRTPRSPVQPPREVDAAGAMEAVRTSPAAIHPLRESAP